jgi:hypothetical protein
MNRRNQCIVPEFLSVRCFANRTGSSRVISCRSRDKGVECLLSCNHYKDHGRDMCDIMTQKVTPSRLIKVDKVAVCDRGG